MPRSDDPARAGDRIAKLLARAGVASRREVERMIAEGRIALDGAPVATPATVLTSLAGVTLDGQPVAAAEPTRLFLFHKPVGLLVTERDSRGRPTIYDRLPADLPRLVPVGRLDLNTEGLLLLTTDGGLKRQLELPASGVERTDPARAYGQVSQAQLEALIEGVEIEGVRYGAIDANLERRTGANVWIELTLTEGKNREVRRVLEHLGLRVGRLIRTRYGPFVLGDLPPGGIGEVRERDLDEFRRLLDRRAKPDRVIAVAPTGSTPKPKRALRSAAPAKTAEPRTKPPGVGPRYRPDARADEGGGAVAMRSEERRTAEPKRARSKPSPLPRSSPQLDPRPRRGGDAAKAAGATGEPSAPRPPRPQRKPGWARPKPKAGHARPRKPRP